jgi:hypothetical protein
MRCALSCKSAQSSSYVTKTEMILVICNSTSGHSFVHARQSGEQRLQHATLKHLLHCGQENSISAEA